MVKDLDKMEKKYKVKKYCCSRFRVDVEDKRREITKMNIINFNLLQSLKNIGQN